MNPTLRPAARRVLALGAAAGAWLALSAWAPLGTPLPAGTVHPTEPARILVAQADAAPAEVKVSYTAEQAEHGEDEYMKHCVECHGEDLRGGLLGGPPLRGAGFEAKYANGAPAGALYEFMSTLMPPDSPGRYSATVYAELMAFILKRNGFKTGAELPSDLDALYALTMTK